MIFTSYRSTGDPHPEETGSKLSRNLTTRLDKIKKQYKRELLPLTQQRERLEREVDELKAHRDLLLEETTVLNLRNEELAQLTQQYLRRMEGTDASATAAKREKFSQSLDKPRPPQYSGSVFASALNDEGESRIIRVGKPDVLDAPASSFRPPKFLKWHGKASREHLAKEPAINIVPPEMTPSKPRPVREHVFQQFSALRFARCDHCGDKMWGSHLRCTGRHAEFISGCQRVLIVVPQVAICPSILSAFLMFIQPAHQPVAETTQLPTLALSVSSNLTLPCVAIYPHTWSCYSAVYVWS